ncbi:495_t:CDS:2, partial [Cetraspora pellucida]
EGRELAFSAHKCEGTYVISRCLFNDIASKNIMNVSERLTRKYYYNRSVICLAKSLMRVKTKYPLLVLVPNLNNEETDLNNEDYTKLIKFGLNYDFCFIEIKEINRIYLNVKQYIIDYYKEASTKICAWDIEGYDLVGLLDADMCIIRNMDELLELNLSEDKIAACHACK